MIKRLQKKFILINMLLVSAVLLIVFTAICVSTYQQQQQINQQMLGAVIDMKENFGPKQGPFDRGKGRHPGPFTATFTVMVNDANEISYVLKSEFDVSDEVLNSAVEQALASSEKEGKLRDPALRYLKKETPDGLKIAFADRSSQIFTLQKLLATSLGVGACGLIAFFFISVFLSSWALRPVKRAWEQQRQFVADASHELKTPLTVILANLGILFSHKEEPIEQHIKWVENTQTEATRMKTLVEDMLFLAKSDADQTVPDLISMNLSDMVWNCILTFEPVAFEKGVEMQTDISPEIMVKGNGNQLKQLLMILLDNACKYAEKGQGTEKPVITVSLRKRQNQAILKVNNTGIPIPAESLPHIFERFYRADKSRVRQAGGYGLGLSIANSIANGHHGQISVTSNHAEGTSFVVQLPIIV